MNINKVLPFAALAIIGCGEAAPDSNKPAAVMIDYPETRKEEVVDILFGTPVSDPYPWLEDDNAPETMAWVKAQNKVTRAYSTVSLTVRKSATATKRSLITRR